MTTAQEILKLIESVDPEDKKSLAEIDAQVWAYLKLNADFQISFGGSGSIYYRHNTWPLDAHTILHYSFEHPAYTTSRDSLKAIRPEGYYFSIDYLPCYEWQAGLNDPDISGNWFTIKGLPTEELAELHAIIQAIEYERTHQRCTQTKS